MPRLRVSVKRLREGMVVMEDVYAKTGVILVMEGTCVTKEVIGLLTKHFIEEVIVEYSNDKRQVMNPVKITEPADKEKQFDAFKTEFVVAEHALSDNFKEIVYQSRDVDMPALLGLLNGMLEKMDDDAPLTDMLLRMKQQRSGLYAHSINVALFGQLLARWIGCSQEEIELVSAAGLLHDIGFLELWKNNPEQDEFGMDFETEKYEKHVICGYNIVKNQDVDSRVKQAVLTHHEYVNGDGFPLHVSGENINKISRIIAIADTYDMLTMAREGTSGNAVFQAIKKMQEDGYGKLDSTFLLVFLERIAETMIQRRVLLNDGREARVIMIDKYRLFAPLVQVDGVFVDLAKQNRLSIKEVLED